MLVAYLARTSGPKNWQTFIVYVDYTHFYAKQWNECNYSIRQLVVCMRSHDKNAPTFYVQWCRSIYEYSK